MIQKLDHVGIAVRSLEERLRFWAGALGLEADRIESVETEGVKIAILPVGDSAVELLEPTRSDSVVARFLDKRGEGVHHLTFEVEDLPGFLAQLRADGVRALDEIPRVGAMGRRVAFLHPRAAGGVLVELVMKSRPSASGNNGMEPGQAVLVYLRDAHEKMWGVLRRLDAAGLVLEGLDLASFDDWVMQVERGDESVVGPSVVFLPMSRVERIVLDRPAGRLPSLSDRFLDRTGRSVREVLG